MNDSIMKSEETKYEETLYDGNPIDSSSEANFTEETDTRKENNSENGSVWRKAGINMGLGILLGSSTSFMTSSTMNNPVKPDDPNEPVKPEKPTETTSEEQQVWSDGKVEVATSVNDEMSFSQAFGSARSEVGSGGAFEWRGNVYSTYTAEEWDRMSAEDKETYNDHFNWSRHTATTSQTTATAETQPVAMEQPEKPEVIATEEVPEKPIVEVEVDVQDITPEVEILGVAHDDETGANFGLMTVDEQEILFIDVDDNGEFDVMISDANGDGQITDNEASDVSEYHMSVSDFESNSFGGGDMYASNDDSLDYINDADVDYGME